MWSGLHTLTSFGGEQFLVKYQKFWKAVYPPRIAPIGLKLCQNAFQTIPDVSFFDAQNKISAKFSDRNFIFSLFWPGFCVYATHMCVVSIHNTHVCCVYTQHTCVLCIYTTHMYVVYSTASRC